MRACVRVLRDTPPSPWQCCCGVAHTHALIAHCPSAVLRAVFGCYTCLGTALPCQHCPRYVGATAQPFWAQMPARHVLICYGPCHANPVTPSCLAAPSTMWARTSHSSRCQTFSILTTSEPAPSPHPQLNPIPLLPYTDPVHATSPRRRRGAHCFGQVGPRRDNRLWDCCAVVEYWAFKRDWPRCRHAHAHPANRSEYANGSRESDARVVNRAAGSSRQFMFTTSRICSHSACPSGSLFFLDAPTEDWA